MTVDGFGFGTLTAESCLKNVHCHTDRACWDAILVTVVAFGAQFRLGEGGGGDTIGGETLMLHIQVPVCLTYHLHVSMPVAQGSSRVRSIAVRLQLKRLLCSCTPCEGIHA